jgi:HTH-type transcriptional regulator/antitoxin HigA
MRRELDGDEAEYLDVLADLMARYEEKNHPVPDAPEGDVLRLLMEDRKLSQQALEKETGVARSTLSAVLGGARSLTKEQVVALARFFGVSPLVFLPKTA